MLNFLASLTGIPLPLMENVLTQLAGSVLVPLGLIATASATDAAIQNKILGSGMEELDDVMKIIKSLVDAGLLIKGFNETVENKVKELKGRYFGMIATTLGASLLRSMLNGIE